MARRKRWEELPIINGCADVKLFSWKYFTDYVRQEMLDYETYIWRGQRSSNWRLQSTLDRLIEEAKIAKTKRNNFRKQHLERFQFSVRGRRGSNPPVIQDENDWWSLGQHHGLATPLLDWTSSPFAAAYFAFIGKGTPQTRHRAIYALNMVGVENKIEKIISINKKYNENLDDANNTSRPKGIIARELLKKSIKPEVQFIRPKSDENQRLVNQSGLFSRAPDGEDIDSWIQRNFEGNTKYYQLIKILIPNKDREEALKMLNRMNINHLTLFPDLYGASKFSNLYGEIERY
ncbi:MAG: FRG domain-containing protein [Haliea sp.]